MSPDPRPLLPASPGSRIDVIRQWLIGTFVGRAFLVGASIKLVAFLLSLILGRSRGLDAFDAIGDIALVAATIALGYRLYVDLKRRLLWRVRRKLIVSYIFIGFVPVLLVIAFFLVSGTLLFLNVSAYVLRNRIATVVDQTQFLAQTAAIEVQRAQNEREVADALARRQAAAVRALSDGVLCGRAGPAGRLRHGHASTVAAARLSPGRGRTWRRRRRFPTGCNAAMWPA